MVVTAMTTAWFDRIIIPSLLFREWWWRWWQLLLNPMIRMKVKAASFHLLCLLLFHEKRIHPILDNTCSQFSLSIESNFTHHFIQIQFFMANLLSIHFLLWFNTTRFFISLPPPHSLFMSCRLSISFLLCIALDQRRIIIIFHLHFYSSYSFIRSSLMTFDFGGVLFSC